MTEKPSIDHILAESDGEFGRFAWEGTFADYLQLVVEDPSRSRLAHDLIHEAVIAKGVETTPDGVSVYGLFKDDIFGMERALERIVRYLDGSARRLEIRKRILLLLGPPASGKSTIVELIKRALEEYTRTDEGAVYAIAGCPIQEDPLHLVPERLRPALLDHYGVYVEGVPCHDASSLSSPNTTGRPPKWPYDGWSSPRDRPSGSATSSRLIRESTLPYSSAASIRRCCRANGRRWPARPSGWMAS